MSRQRRATPGRIEKNWPLGIELRRRRGLAHRVAKLLHEQYGSPKHSNKDDPVDEVVFIILSQMTTHHSFNRVFDRLKDAVPRWGQIIEMPVSQVQSIIADAGLSGQKAPRIREIVEHLQADFGAITLDPLRTMDDDKAETYLTSLPGIGLKSARCVLMYSLGRAVLPADTHVWRVSRRLGLVSRDVTYPQLHGVLHHIVRPADRYRFHVNVIPLGRQFCIAKTARCCSCPLVQHCPTGHRNAGASLGLATGGTSGPRE